MSSGHAAAIAQAIKASGTIVRLKPEQFLTILSRQFEPLVVFTKGGVFRENYQYLTSYKGLAFFTKSPKELTLPSEVEVIVADLISIPS